MTIQEAIKILEQDCPKRPQKLWSIKRKEAVTMAIEALESQERQKLIVGSYLIEEPSCSEEPNRSEIVSNIQRHPSCKRRTSLGNCDPVGGFCTSVPNDICEEHYATDTNRSDLISRTDAIDEIRMLMEQSEDDEHDRIWNMALVGAMNAVRHHTPSAEPKTANSGSLEKEMPEIKADRTTDGIIYRQDAKDRLTVLVNEIEGIFADIRERNVDDSVCGLCEYDCDHGIDGSAFECLGFERDDCFKLKDEYREEWTDVKDLPSAQPDNFLEFLWNVINPNEMQGYLEMYWSGEEKTNG